MNSRRPQIHFFVSMVFTLLTAASLFAGAGAVTVAPIRCETVLLADTAQGLQDSWKPTAGSLFMAIRSNCFHFWSWVRLQSKSDIPAGLLAEGLVIGDPHILNFGDIFFDGKRRFRMNDIDDVGRGYFFFDFIKFVTASKALRLNLTTDDLFEMYRKGLAEEKIEKPEFVDRALELSRKKEENRQEEYLEKITDKDRFRTDVMGLKRLEDSTPAVQKIYKEVAPQLQKALSNYKILDRVVRVKEEGGSAGLPRFWFLIETSEGERHMIEFKEMPKPGTRGLFAQGNAIQRIKEFMKVYWGDKRDPLYRIFEISGHDYYMRPRFFKNLDFSKIQSDGEKEEARQFSLYLAYYMGRMVARQSGAKSYIDTILRDSPQAFQIIDRYTSAYLKEIRALHSQ